MAKLPSRLDIREACGSTLGGHHYSTGTFSSSSRCCCNFSIRDACIACILGGIEECPPVLAGLRRRHGRSCSRLRLHGMHQALGLSEAVGEGGVRAQAEGAGEVHGDLESTEVGADQIRGAVHGAVHEIHERLPCRCCADRQRRIFRIVGKVYGLQLDLQVVRGPGVRQLFQDLVAARLHRHRHIGRRHAAGRRVVDGRHEAT
mmetsp:Transcript_82748/g.210532  ORF Transcript_82748/g.210532 Transcript_82748/m.210532 type:complete len:203 (-) Transcript_82748:600-1208(-)